MTSFSKPTTTNTSSSGKKNGAVPTVSYFLTNFFLPAGVRTSAKLRKTNTNLGSYGTHDANLAFAGYGLLFISEVLKRLSSSTATAAAGAAAAGNGSTGSLLSSIIQKLPLVPSSSLSSAASTLAAATKHSRALANLISDVRIFNRLWGLVPLSVWALDVWARPPKDSVLRAIAYAQVAVNIAYQPLENVAYLAMHDVISKSWVSDRAQLLLWIYSCYLWAAHVVLDFIRVFREYQLARKAATTVVSLDSNEKSKTQASSSSPISQDQIKAWKQALIINLSYLPLTVHWSLEKGCLSDIVVGFLGATAAYASIKPRWDSICATPTTTTSTEEEQEQKQETEVKQLEISEKESSLLIKKSEPTQKNNKEEEEIVKVETSEESKKDK